MRCIASTLARGIVTLLLVAPAALAQTDGAARSDVASTRSDVASTRNDVPLPPRAHAEAIADTHHGVRVDDPYRWLEDLRSEDTHAWARAHALYARSVLARVQGRDELGARIAALSDAAGDQVRDILRMPGGRIYYLKRGAGADQFTLMMRIGVDGDERVILDPASAGGGAITYWRPSWDGRLLAFGIAKGGSEQASLEVIDIATGQRVGQPVPRVTWTHLHWTPDSRRLAYTQRRELPPGAPDSEFYLDTTVHLLDLREPAPQARPGARGAQGGRPGATRAKGRTRAARASREDSPSNVARSNPTASTEARMPASKPIFGREHNPALRLDRLAFGEVIFSPDSRFMVARTTDTTSPEGKLFVAPLSALDGRGPIAWRPIATAKDRIVEVHLRGERLYLRTRARSPKGEVMALDLRQPVLARATRMVGAPAQGAIEGFLVGRDAVLTEVRDPFRRRVWRHASGGGAGRELTGGDNVGLVREPMREGGDALVTVASWTRPTRVATIDTKGALRDTTIARTAAVGALADAPELESYEDLVPSHDGVRVPVAVVHRRGLRLDGRRPTILMGYGAYGSSISAGFDARSIAWLEQGGVLAYANVRGSGAYGDAWHRAGFKATKPNTWKDGLAVARWLIERQYASPKTLAAWGRSAGGVFVGRMVTSVPELFGAAVFDVALLDTVRAETSANGATNVSEFGTVKDPKEFAALLDMSTYHHVRAGAPYPAVLLVHGMNDPRVDAWHTLKTGARLLAANRHGAPVLMRIDTNDGHGVGRTTSQGVEQLADIYGFLLWRLGQRRLEAEAQGSAAAR